MISSWLFAATLMLYNIWDILFWQILIAELVSETCAIALQQGGMQATQFASTIDGSIDCAGLFFFIKTRRRLVSATKKV